jgi:hypothetical protein
MDIMTSNHPLADGLKEWVLAFPSLKMENYMVEGELMMDMQLMEL